jgi:predicted PurR-regulated permease PerM
MVPKARACPTLSERIRNAGLTSWALIGIALLAYGFLRYLIAPLGVIFAPVAIAVVVVYLLNPLVTILQRRRIRRGFAVLIVWLVFLAIVTTIMSFLIPLASDQISSLINNVPSYAQKIVTEINQFAAERNLDFRATLTQEQVSTFVSEHREQLVGYLGAIPAVAFGVVHLVITLVIGLVLSIYILLDLPKIHDGFFNLIPDDYKDEAHDIGQKIGSTLGGFFRGQLLVALFVGIASALGLTAVKIPSAVVVGIVAGVFNLVPLIGPFIGAVPAVILGLLSGHPIRALYAMIVLLVVQQVDNHIISPNVMGRTVKLHPITVMLALLVGGTVAGLFGMLMVIPVVATVKILASHVWLRRRELGVPEAIADAGSP